MEIDAYTQSCIDAQIADDHSLMIDDELVARGYQLDRGLGDGIGGTTGGDPRQFLYTCILISEFISVLTLMFGFYSCSFSLFIN